MNNSIIQSEILVITFVFYFYILMFMLRFLFQLVRADFYNPLSQLVVKLTHWPLRYIRKVIPGYARIDTSSLLMLIILNTLKIILLCFIVGRGMPQIHGLALWTLGDLLTLLCNIFFYSMLIQAVLSWVNPMLRSPMTDILHALTEPLLRPARRIIPNISGFDLSPIPVMLGLQIFIMLVAYPLVDVGKNIALS